MERAMHTDSAAKPSVLVRPPRRIAGYAGLMILAILGIAAAVMMMTTLDASALRNDQDRKTGYALAQAKQALIGRAASDNNRPGSLPCPDIDNDGQATVGVEYIGNTCASYVGRLPWKTLGLPDLRDADGERLWYALSPNFRDATGVVINAGTTGTLTVNGNMTVANAAAIVFAPGGALNGQTRDTGNANAQATYLDGPNAAATTTFQAQTPAAGFNDRLIAVSPTDLTAVTGMRVTREISAAFDAYLSAGATSLPYAASGSNAGCQAGGDATTCTAQTGLNTGVIPAVPTATYPQSPVTPTASQQAYLDSPLGPNGWFTQNDWRQWVAYSVTSDCASSVCKEDLSASFKVTPYTGDAETLKTAKAQLTVYKVDPTGMYYTTSTYLVR
jgi:hypothetical protein